MPTKRTRVPRPTAQIAVALAAALVAGITFVLGMVAALGFTWDPAGSVIVALAAVWLPQTLITAARYGRR